VLAFDGRFLAKVLAFRESGGVQQGAYCVRACELLFCGDDGSGSLGSVECGLAFHNCLALGASTPCTSLAADASDLIPILVGHVRCGIVVDVIRLW
jgi:hypothetical protein